MRSGQPCGEQRHGRPAHASGYPDHPGQPHSFGGGEPTPAYARPHAGGGGARPHTRPTSDPDPGSNLHPRVRGDEPADEAILAAYEKAEEAWGWFEIAPMPLDRDDQRTVGEQVYCRVDYPGIKTLADLRGYLKSLFSDGLVEELLPVDGTQYVELDGALYTIDGGRGADITKGEETVQVLRDGTPGRCTVRVTVEVLDPQQGFSVVGSENHDFLYEQVGERWIFTTFSMVR